MQTFLRGIESDLRALCADARRRNPTAKAAAEGVILQLKEADDDEALSRAADAAASAFCTACEIPTASASTSAALSVRKITSRAVACLHKLLTHKAVSPNLLPTILQATEKVGVASIDDNITLKVLQVNISLLTVREYAHSLSEPELARSFALFFKLSTTAVPCTPVAAASSTLSSISSGGAPPVGVVEPIARASFRQVAAYLFTSALERQHANGTVISTAPLDANPIEVRASYRLFQDLCALLSKGSLLWLSEEGSADPEHFKDIEEVLIVEVIDDALSGNVQLFRDHPLFSDLVSTALAPIVLELVVSAKEKHLLKAVLSLSATIIRSFSKKLGENCKKLLQQLTKNISVVKARDGVPAGWITLYSLEALRCIFSGEEGPELFTQFVLAYDLSPDSSPLVSGIVSAVADVVDIHDVVDISKMPMSPLKKSSKPFGSMSSDSYEIVLAVALGLFISFGNGVLEASSANDLDTVRVFTALDVSARMVGNVAEITKNIPIPSGKTSAHTIDLWKAGLQNLLNTLSSFGIASYNGEVSESFDQTLASLSSACIQSLKQSSSLADPSGSTIENACGSFRIMCAYNAMFTIQENCGERLGRNWGIVLNALVALDEKLFGGLTVTQLAAASDSNGNEVYRELKQWLEHAFVSARQLSWNAIEELISALIHSSRAAIQALSKRPPEEAAKAEILPAIRMFGIAWAETVVSSILQHASERDDRMPQGLWELLTGHLVSICVDSNVEFLRTTALKTFSRVSAAALACEVITFIPHGKIISPFMDLLQCPFAGTRSETLACLRQLLQTNGDKISGMAAWATVLSILRSTCGHKDVALQNGNEEEGDNNHVQPPVVSSESMVSDGFRVVQLIADDFLPCLENEVLPRWVYVIGGYSRQTEDVNVALTAIGLLWRTADFIATNYELKSNDMLWITLLSELKDIGHDERPEIRNCAVKTLTGTLKAHAANLSAIAWEGVIASSLLPLLENVMLGGESTAEKNSDESATSLRNKVDSQLIVHHSRNTPRKQWNETRVLALEGVASVLSIALPILADLRDLQGKPVLLLLADNERNGLWGNMLQLASTAAASQDSEVALAGIASLLELLNAAGEAVARCVHTGISDECSSKNGGATKTSSGNESPSLGNTSLWISGMLSSKDSQTSEDSSKANGDSKKISSLHYEGSMSLWEVVWQTLTNAICIDSEPSSLGVRRGRITNEKALVQLAEGLKNDKTHLDPKLSHKSSPYLLKILFYLVSSNVAVPAEQSPKHVQSDELSEVAFESLKTIRSIRFGEDKSSWKCMLENLVTVIENHSSKEEAPVATFHVITIIKELYSSSGRVPVSVLNDGLLDTVCALSLIMNERHRGNNPQKMAPGEEPIEDVVVSDGMPLWSVATIAFETAMHTVSGFMSAPSSFWDSICKVLIDFLYPSVAASMGGWGESIPFGARAQAQEYDILLARCIRDFLPYLNKATLGKTRESLVELLARGAEEGKTSRRPRFVRACQEYIFNLADQRWAQSRSGLAKNDIANICARKVTQVSDEILRQFIADGQRAGKCPLPAERRAEVMFLMRKLRNLQAFVDDVNSDGPGSKRHMLTLYPRLAECVDVGDIAVRNVARALIDESSSLR